MSSLVNVAMRRAGEGRLDKPVALMMGVAAGALMFMMPIWRLEQAAVASGLAGIFSPASPPLGMTARALAAVVAAVIGFGIAFALMRLVDRASGLFEPADRTPRDDEAEEPAPRMRRRDLHPDAPIRRPLSAMRDLGVPDPVADEPVAPRRRSPLAAALDEAPMPRMPWEKEWPSAEPEAQPRVRAPLFAEPEPEPEQEPAPEPAPEVVEAEAAAPGDDEPTVPAPLDLDREEPEKEPDAHREDEPEAEPEPEPVAAEPVPEPEPEPVPVRAAEPAARRPDGQETIGELLARLERALDRRQAPAPRRPAVASEATGAPNHDEPIDTRLRSALENLKRFAPQRG